MSASDITNILKVAGAEAIPINQEPNHNKSAAELTMDDVRKDPLKIFQMKLLPMKSKLDQAW